MDQVEWVHLLQARDENAWREFIRTYAHFAPIVAHRFGLMVSDHDDILQDMTVTALRSISNLRDPSRLSSWTFTIATRAAITIKKSRSAGPTSLECREHSISAIPSSDPPVDEILAIQEDIRQLRRGMGQLSELCRGILEGLFLKDPRLSYREVSERFGVPIGSIGPNLARCLKRLRRAIRTVSEPGKAEPVGLRSRRGRS